jgi:hypothetical protein
MRYSEGTEGMEMYGAASIVSRLVRISDMLKERKEGRICDAMGRVADWLMRSEKMG